MLIEQGGFERPGGLLEAGVEVVAVDCQRIWAKLMPVLFLEFFQACETSNAAEPAGIAEDQPIVRGRG